MATHNFFSVSGKGPNLVLLHGWKHDRHTWDNLLPFLEPNFTCWTIDLPGFGTNPRPNATWSIPEYANWVKKVIVDNNIKQPTLVGHSFGGRVVIELNKSVSDIKQNVLYATPGLRQPIPVFKSFAYSFYQGLKQKTSIIKHAKVIDRVNFMHKLRNKMRSSDYKEAGELKDIFLATIHYNLTPGMEDITKPTTLLWGTEDNIVPIKIATEMQKIIPNSNLVSLAGLGHLAHLENPRLFSGKLLAILNNEHN
jgi:pimeloyl-ACP methyl ester carboxylesterase